MKSTSKEQDNLNRDLHRHTLLQSSVHFPLKPGPHPADHVHLRGFIGIVEFGWNGIYHSTTAMWNRFEFRKSGSTSSCERQRPSFSLEGLLIISIMSPPFPENKSSPSCEIICCQASLTVRYEKGLTVV